MNRQTTSIAKYKRVKAHAVPHLTACASRFTRFNLFYFYTFQSIFSFTRFITYFLSSFGTFVSYSFPQQAIVENTLAIVEKAFPQISAPLLPEMHTFFFSLISYVLLFINSNICHLIRNKVTQIQQF